MASRRAIVAVLATSGLVAAQNATAFSGPGPYSEGQEYLQDASVTAEKTVPFDLFFPNDGDAPQWQLVTRLEEAAPPDSQIPNAAVLNTVYDFGFPNSSGNLTEAVAASSGQLDQKNFCVTILESLLPNKEANRYKADTEQNASDGSCRYALRDECLNAINSRIAETQAAEDGCRLSNLKVTDIVQCQWIFDENTRLSTYNLLAPELVGNLTDGFAYITSDPYDGANRTFVDIAETRIHMVIIDSGNTFTPLCVKLDATRDQVGSASIASASTWLVATAVIGALAYAL